MAMQGIDTILQHLANASTALERTARPGIKEVKEAAGSAKIAADLLKASETFLANGIYVICDEPASAYVDPAFHTIEMPVVVDELPPMPDLFDTDFTGFNAEGQTAAFESALEDLEKKGFEVLPDVTDWDCSPWWTAFDSDRLTAWQKLMFSIHYREPFLFEVPTDDEFATWRAGFAVDAPEASETDSPKCGLAEFQKMLDQLEEAGVEQGLKRKDWKKANKTWWAAQGTDPLGAFSKLEAALAATTISWDVPADHAAEVS